MKAAHATIFVLAGIVQDEILPLAVRLSEIGLALRGVALGLFGAGVRPKKLTRWGSKPGLLTRIFSKRRPGWT
jgi:hypothetical protein